KKRSGRRTDRSSITSSDALGDDLERQRWPRPGSLARVVDRAVGTGGVDREAIGAVARDRRRDVEVGDLAGGDRTECRQGGTVDGGLRVPGDGRFTPGAVADGVDPAARDAVGAAQAGDLARGEC